MVREHRGTSTRNTATRIHGATQKGMRGVVKCGKLVMACGLWEPNILPMVGIDLADGYETLPEKRCKIRRQDDSDYGYGQLCIRGCQVFRRLHQFCAHLAYARQAAVALGQLGESVQRVAARQHGRITRWYLLDTLDALGLSDFVVANPKRMMIVKCLGNQLCLFNRNTDPETGDHVALLGYYDPASPFQAAFVANMSNMGLQTSMIRDVGINQNRVARVTTDAENGISVDDSAQDPCTEHRRLCRQHYRGQR